jgi:hypothetical protein
MTVDDTTEMIEKEARDVRGAEKETQIVAVKTETGTGKETETETETGIETGGAGQTHDRGHDLGVTTVAE